MTNKVLFLGGSGYICTNIRKKIFPTNKNIIYYSRRVSSGCERYSSIDELPKSDLIIDCSQWANGNDSKLLGIEKMKEAIIKATKICNHYVFLSTLSIEINQSCGYMNDKYSENKLLFENFIFSKCSKNVYILRIPACFCREPKNGTLIDLLFKRANGSTQEIREPDKFTTGIEINDLFDFFKYLILNTENIPNLFGANRILCLGDGFAYKISELDYFLKRSLQEQFSQEKKYIYPPEHIVSLLENSKNTKWHLQPSSFPARLFNAIKESRQHDIHNC